LTGGPPVAGAGEATADPSCATVWAKEEPAFCTSEVPHILQKFMPGGLTVPQALQAVPAGCAPVGLASASSFWPQSWQNSDPSRLTFPQRLQRGIARLTSGVLFPL
jgi:hypothetical protein